MSAPSATVVEPTLADHCAAVIKLVCTLDAAQAADAEVLATRFQSQLTEVEARAQRAGLAL